MSLFWWKRLPQYEHGYGRVSLCINKWVDNVLDRLKALPHCLHSNTFSTECTALSVLKSGKMWIFLFVVCDGEKTNLLLLTVPISLSLFSFNLKNRKECDGAKVLTCIHSFKLNCVSAHTNTRYNSNGIFSSYFDNLWDGTKCTYLCWLKLTSWPNVLLHSSHANGRLPMVNRKMKTFLNETFEIVHSWWNQTYHCVTDVNAPPNLIINQDYCYFFFFWIKSKFPFSRARQSDTYHAVC